MPSGISIVGATILAAILALVSVPSAAMADSDIDVPFVWEQPTVVIEYGQYWTFSGAASDSMGFPADPPPAVVLSGAASYKPDLSTYKTGQYLDAYYVSPSNSQAALGVGTYPVVLTATGMFVELTGKLNFHLKPTVPAQLTIKPAALTVDFRILADTNNRDGAVISGRLTGSFANDYAYSAGYPASPVGPGGSWVYTITDTTGEPVLEKTITTEPGDVALASSFYWADAEPGETYNGSVQFTPDTASISNFAITQAPDFSYTTPELQRPIPVSTLAPAAEAAPEESADFSVPLWALLLVGLVALGLTTTVVLLSLRYVRLRQEPIDTIDVATTQKELVQ